MGSLRIPTEDLITLHEYRNTPLVVINRRINRPDIPCIVVDFENAAYRSAQHLLDLNHTRLAYLVGLESSESSHARRLGIENGISVVGCDGLLIAAHCNPPLTTIDQPKYNMGRLAMQTLRQMLNDQRPPMGGIHYWRVLSSFASRVAHACASKDVLLP
jgi:DNA-binding LacI/PurR family transcriptional regulator